MKKTFKITLKTEVNIDFDGYGFSDAQIQKEDEFKRIIINEYLDQCGLEEFEVTEKEDISLFETMSEMFNPNKK